MASDYYKILGISRKANEQAIKKAFRDKAMHYHPDRNKAPNATEKFIAINEAYECLSDPEKRKAYDLLLSRQYGDPRKRRATQASQEWEQVFRQWAEQHGAESRERASRYAKMNYKAFKEEAFPPIGEFLASRLSGCALSGIIGVIPATAVISIGFWLDITVITIIGIFIYMPVVILLSNTWDNWYDRMWKKRQARKKRTS